MVSSFGWLDADDDQQRGMLDVLDLFRERSTLDDLGVGAIRDAFADEMFPGTSTLHTRLRYVLFVPWLIQRAATTESTPDRMRSMFSRDEYRLIQSLRNAGNTQGVIGARVGRNLRIWPSTMYWSCLRTWGIAPTGASLDSVFRQAAEQRALLRRTIVPDDQAAADGSGGSHGSGTRTIAALDAGLPAPPDDLLRATGFDLRPEEERYLSERITQSTVGSLLAWLVVNPPAVLPEHPWELPMGTLPPALAHTLDHARRFSVAIHGAHLVYNLLVAELTGSVELETTYRADLAAWERELTESGVLEHWDLLQFWGVVTRRNPRVPPPTRTFVDSWLRLLTEHVTQSPPHGPVAVNHVADNPAIRQLVSDRERSIKRSRARLANPAARDSWSGASGLGRFVYRWPIARSHLADLCAARRSQSPVPESA